MIVLFRPTDVVCELPFPRNHVLFFLHTALLSLLCSVNQHDDEWRNWNPKIGKRYHCLAQMLVCIWLSDAETSGFLTVAEFAKFFNLIDNAYFCEFAWKLFSCSACVVSGFQFSQNDQCSVACSSAIYPTRRSHMPQLLPADLRATVVRPQWTRFVRTRDSSFVVDDDLVENRK